MESCWLPVPGALWANVFALFYRAFRGDRRRRSSRRTVSKSVEDGPVLSFLFVLLSSYPSLAFSLSRDFDRTPGGTRGGILFFSFASVPPPTLHPNHHGYSLSSLPVPLSHLSSSTSSLSFGRRFLFFPSLSTSLFRFLLFLSFFRMNARACTGRCTERPARWASALIGDATRMVEQRARGEVGPRVFFERYLR